MKLDVILKDPKWQSRGLFLLKLVISGLLVYWVFRGIDAGETLRIITHLDPGYAFLAVLCFIFSKGVSAFRLNTFFSAIDVQLSHIFNLKLYLLGMFYNVFLPGGISGDGYKIYWLRKKGYGHVRGLFGAILWDRISGMISLLILAFVTFPFTDGMSGTQGAVRVPQIVLAALEGCRSALALMYREDWIVIALIPMVLVLYVMLTARLYPRFKPVLGITTLQSFLVQGFQLLSICFIARASGYDWTDPVVYFIFLVSSVVAVLPLSIGGLGLREFVFLSGATLYGMEADHAVAISLIFYGITLGVSLFGLYLILRPLQGDGV